MRIESSVTSVSWIPREAIEGMVKLPFELGVAHYDLPPPDRLDDLEGLLESSAIRFANELRAWIEVDDNGRVTGYGHLGRGHMGHTRIPILTEADLLAVFARYGVGDMVGVEGAEERIVQLSPRSELACPLHGLTCVPDACRSCWFLVDGSGPARPGEGES